jgi:uncharacterized protein
VHLPAFDVPGVGRLAMVADPQGVPFYVMRGEPDERSTAFQRMGLHHVSWNELQTPDDAATLAFYDRQFGITKVGAMPMGPLGEYHFITNAESGGDAIGAVMPVPPGGRPGWSFYFRIDDIERGLAAVRDGGGTVLHGPTEVPGGERVVQALDPEGAFFGLVADGRAAA